MSWLSTPVQEVDALLVLGGEDRTQWHRSRAAAAYFLACRKAGLALPRVLVTGGASARLQHAKRAAPAAHRTEAASMAEFLLAEGVPRSHLLQEACARDTLGNVALGGAMAARHGLQRLLLVSDDFHLWRARRLFERVWGRPPLGCLGTGYAGTWHLRCREKLAFALQLATLQHARVLPGDSKAHLDFLASRATPRAV